MLNFIKKLFSASPPSPTPPPNGPPEPAITDSSDEFGIMKNAFNNVMKEISALSKEDKEAMCSDFFEAYQSGRPANQTKVCGKWLYEKKWNWPWFNTWEKRFNQSGEYPAMWKGIQKYRKGPVLPEKIDDALVFLTVADMRKCLKDNSVNITPTPQKRVDFETALNQNCTMDHIKDVVEEKVNILREEYIEKCVRWKIELLAHTLMMSFYGLRRRLQVEEVKSMGRVPRISSCGCKIEEMIAQQEFQTGKYPPFFPGDRSTLVSKREPRNK